MLGADDASRKDTRIESCPRRPIGRDAFVLLLVFLLANMGASARVAATDDHVRTVLDSISGSRMIETVAYLEAFGTRAFYLDSSKRAAQYISERFMELGLRVEQHEFELGSTEVANIVAVLNGTSPCAPQFLFGAHYDSENRMVKNYSDALNMLAPGADDDASGVAAIIELATVLSGMNLSCTVKFAAFGAEEYGYDGSGGLKGSAYFVARERTSGTEYLGTAILDMIGYKKAETNTAFGIVNAHDNAFAKHVSTAVSKYRINLTFEVRVDPSITFSDHAPFWSAGYPSVLVIEELSGDHEPVNPFYHTPNDTSDRLSEDQMREVTKAMAAGLLELLCPREDAPVLVIGLLAAAAAAVMVVVLHRRNARRKD